MVESDIKIYKLNYSGTFEEQPSDNPIDLFTLYTILAIYSKKSKRMYIWVSKNATNSLKIFIPQIRELFSKKYPKLRILRNITVESGEEPLEFFELFDFEKEIFEDHILTQKKLIEPIFNEISELKDKLDAFIKEGQYQEAIEISEQLINLSKEIKDKSLQGDQEELLSNLKERQKLKKIYIDIEKKGSDIKKEFENLINQNKINEAHELVNNFKKEIEKYEVNLTSIPIIEELFLKEENIWHSTKLEEKSLITKLSMLEKDFKTLLKEENYVKSEEIVQNAIEIIDSISDNDLIQKWNKIKQDFIKQKIEHDKKQEQINQQILTFQENIEDTLNKNFLTETIRNCKALLEFAKENKILNIIEKYSIILEDSERELEETREIVETLHKEILVLKEKGDFDKGIKKINSMLEEIEGPDFIEQRKILDNLKEELFNEKEKRIKINAELKVLEEKISASQEIHRFQEAINTCEKLIKIYEELGKNESIKSYSELIKEIEKKREEERKNIDSLIKQITKLKNEGKLKEGIAKIESIIEDIHEEDFPEEYSKLNKNKVDLLIEYEKRIKINATLKILEEKLSTSQENHKFQEAINLCEQIIKIQEEIGNGELVKNYSEIIKEIKKEREETSEIVDSLIKDINKLKKEGKFKEGIAKIDSIIEDIYEEDFPEEYSNLNSIKEELIAQYGAILKFNEQLKVLEEEFSNSKNENNLHDALTISKKIIQISQDIGKDDKIKNYNKINQDIEKQIEIKREKVNKLFDEIPRLRKKEELEKIITKIDSIVIEIPEIIFSKEKQEFFKIKEEIVDELANARRIDDKIKELEDKLQEEMNSENFDIAKKVCDELIKYSIDNNKIGLATNYTKFLKEINDKIEIKKIRELKDQIMDLSKKGIETINNSMFQESLIHFERIINLLEKYSK